MKKMRRLIPAIAMLLVSAVMLSTASFAWFTMNEAVTASGMQIQAKADGSLLISDAPFTSANLGKADLVISAAVQNLYPMAYHDKATGADSKGTLDLNTTTYATAGWYKPDKNENSNISTGANYGDYAPITSASSYAFKQEYYIATAGDPMPGAEIKVELMAPVHPETGETHKAYAAAIYLVPTTNTTAWADNGDIAFATDAPDRIIYVGEGTTDTTRNTTTLTADIPSIASAVGSAKVGLKVIVYYYVDGALSSAETTNVLLGYQHEAAEGGYDATVAYYNFNQKTLNDGASLDGLYKEVDGVYIPVTGTYVGTETVVYYERELAVLTGDDLTSEDMSDYYVVSMSDAGVPVAEYDELTYTYVRSADIANTPASLELTFSAEIED